jgi:hypothetical protein
MRAAFALAACLLAASGCRSSLPYPSEEELRRDARCVLEEPEFTLFSPYDAAASAHYADAVRAEIGLLRPLIPDAGTTKVRIYLAPLADEQGRTPEPWQTPSKRSLKGAASEGEFAFVYVPARIEDSSALERAAFMSGGTLRHELAHLYASRAGLARAPWFNEGLALEVESMRSAEGALHAHPFPPYLLVARMHAQPGALQQLLRWSYTDDLSDSERSLRYVWAHALFRYLFEQQAQGGFLERARAIADLGEQALLAREPAWLAWLAGLDALERIRAGAHSASPVERSLCSGVLPVLAESGAPELATRAADELALELLGDPVCVDPAATFLIFFRAPELRAQDIEELDRSDDPGRVLTAQALHARRKEPVDLERARAAWQRVPERERDRLVVPVSLIPGLSGGSR